MKRRLPLLFSLAFLLTPYMSRAQEGAPPVLDPADVFTDAVEVVETLPILNADNDARMLWYFDPEAGEWRGFAYPDDLEEVEQYERRSDGTYLLSDHFFFGLASSEIASLWLFNPALGDISRPNAICDALVQALSGEGKWLFSYSPEDGLFRLCNTETGEMSNPLPDDMQPLLNDVCVGGPPGGGTPVTSPDSKWVVFHDCPFLADDQNPATSPMYHVYAYEVTTRQLYGLGSIDNSEYLFVAQWLNNTTPIIIADTIGTFQNGYVYIADVTEPDSLELVAAQEILRPQFYDRPPRYVWAGDFSQRNDGVWRQAHEFNLETREENIFEIPCVSYCQIESIIPNSENPELVLLAESVTGIEYTLSVLDRQTDEILYQTNSTSYPDESNSPFRWLSSDTLLILDVTHVGQEPSVLGRLIQFDENTIVESIIRNIYSNHPFWPTTVINGERLLIDYTSNDSQEINVRNLITRQTTPIIHSPNPELYDLNLVWQDNGLLEVTIVAIEPDGYNSPVISWLVRVP